MTHGTGTDNDERIRADAPILTAARTLAHAQWKRVVAEGASIDSRRDAARRTRVLLRTFPSAFPSGRARSIRSLARTARHGVELHPAAAARIAATIAAGDAASDDSGDATNGACGPVPTLTARRASRRAIARALRKVLRRGRKLDRRSPRTRWCEILEPLRTSIDLADLFRDVAAPEIDGFLRQARAFAERLDRLAADTAAVPDENFVTAWRKFRKRRVIRLAVPDL